MEELNSNQKIAINDYLDKKVKSWLTGLGIANLSALLIAMVYIFFILPGKAVEEAKLLIQSDIDVTRKKLNNNLTDLFTKYGSIQNEALRLETEAKKLEERLEETDRTLNTVLNKDFNEKLNSAATFINDVSGAEDISQLLRRVSTLERRVNGLREPDYKSEDWIELKKGQSVDINHNFGDYPSVYTLLVSRTNDGSSPVYVVNSTWSNSVNEQGRGVLMANSNQNTLKVMGGGFAIFDSYSVTGKSDSYDIFYKGYIRVLLWK